MTLVQLRRYAGKTATELRNAGWRQSTVCQTSDGVDKSVQVGWQLWSHDMTRAEVFQGGFGGRRGPMTHEWLVSSELWLAPSGVITYLETRREYIVDTYDTKYSLPSWHQATDEEITAADQRWLPWGNRRDRSSFVEWGWRPDPAPVAQPGRRISARLTELRKSAGTYVVKARPNQ